MAAERPPTFATWHLAAVRPWQMAHLDRQTSRLHPRGWLGWAGHPSPSTGILDHLYPWICCLICRPASLCLFSWGMQNKSVKSSC
ncbi:hypothetical protein CGRA01v4_02617 [Colletotrichum graminicola]|nr:hypothetical protein CGRA01v4_02617 [Colletotrichum graminicola]